MIWNNERERYEFGGKRLSKRRFKDRYKAYIRKG